MQRFKSVSFPANDLFDSNRVVTLAFAEKEHTFYEQISGLTSLEIRELLGISDYNILQRNADSEQRNVSQYIKFYLYKKLSSRRSHTQNDVTFRASKDLPFQRWYPYIEGYSPKFVESIISRCNENNTLIYEPFAGTGTTIFAADSMGANCCYSEINPLLRFLIDVKLRIMSLSHTAREKLAEKVRIVYDSIAITSFTEDKTLFMSYKNVFKDSVYFPEDTFKRVLELKTAIRNIDDSLVADIITIAVLSCLVGVSFLKKQGDLRFKTEKEKQNEMRIIEDVLPQKMSDIIEDILNFDYHIHMKHYCITENAKDISKKRAKKIGRVITSPPYLNGTNYIRNTKLELWFLGFLCNEKDLRYYRDEILTSGINDVKSEYKKNNNILSKSELLTSTIEKLEAVAYDSRIPLMAKCYFNEMFVVFDGLRKHLTDGAQIFIDLGDSMFSGVHIQTDKILTEIFSTMGYSFIDCQTLRSRRSRNGQILSQVLLSYQYQKS